MIHAVHIANYKSVGDSVSLIFPDAEEDPRLLVLAGVNGVGKSNVLDAIRFVKDALRDGPARAVAERRGSQGLFRHGTSDLRVMFEHDHDGARWYWGLRAEPEETDARVLWSDFGWAIELAEVPRFERELTWMIGRKRSQGIAQPYVSALEEALFSLPAARVRDRFVTTTVTDGPGESTQGRPPRPRGVGLPWRVQENPAWSHLLDALASMRVYHVFPPTLRPPQTLTDDPLLDDDGANWATTLRALDAPALALLRVGVTKIVPDIVDVRVGQLADHLIVEFEHRAADGGTHWVPAHRESDGTLRTVVLLTALLQDPPPALIGIEEPELAVHVHVLPVLVDFIESAARRVPVILSTHSPDLLDHVPLAGVRVVERTDEGTRVVALADDQRRAVEKHIATAGDLLREEGLRAEAPGG